VILLLSLLACSMDIAPSQKGMMFDRSGVLALYVGGDGLTGEVLQPGTYWTGFYDEVRIVDCATSTQKEAMTSLTQDGVQFGVDLYVRFRANCADDAVQTLLSSVPRGEDGVVGSQTLYATFIRGPLGESIRKNVSPYVANDLNTNRTQILDGIRADFLAMLEESSSRVVVEELNLSNMDFPEAMDTANNERAVQAVLRDKAIAEREKLDAEIETAQKREELARMEGEIEGARIDAVGAALKRNPEFMQYDMQAKMPGIYEKAGAFGNMIITAPNPTVLVEGK